MLLRLTASTVIALALMAAPGLAADPSTSGSMTKDESVVQGKQQGVPQNSKQMPSNDKSLEGRFTEFDKDGDGAISRDEWASREKARDTLLKWAEISTDKDDKITKSEWNKFFKKKQAQLGTVTGGSMTR